MNTEEDLNIEAAWIEYRKNVSDNQSKSQDDFEKYINIISSGGLGLTITFFDNIIPIGQAIYIWVIIVGWCLLTLTILVNLYSHHKSAKVCEQTIIHLDKREYNMIEKVSEEGNKIINRCNTFSMLALFLGILLIVLFSSINFYNMSNNNPKPRPVNIPKPATEEKGRLVPSPPPSRPTPPRTNN